MKIANLKRNWSLIIPLSQFEICILQFSIFNVCPKTEILMVVKN